MIKFTILPDDAITVVEPAGPLSENDFAKLGEAVDEFLETHESLKGLLIHTRQFPGWEDFDGMIQHFKFVRNHHQKIRRVALASDSKLASIAPRLAKHFIAAEVKSFGFEDREKALSWLRAD